MITMRFDAPRNLSLVLLFFLLPGISSYAFSERLKVEEATQQLHRLLKQSRFKDIYQQKSSFLQSKFSEDGFDKKLREIKLRIGEIKAIERFDVGSEKPTELQNAKLFTKTFKVIGTSSNCLEIIEWSLEDGNILLDDYDCMPTDN